ncbi:MAG TPA: hypothetical protein DCQ98_11015 [Planctomycetaceae bacterium]|nr:hypothetical protein [Planctomycetaceae bacterium]
MLDRKSNVHVGISRRDRDLDEPNVRFRLVVRTIGRCMLGQGSSDGGGSGSGKTNREDRRLRRSLPQRSTEPRLYAPRPATISG